MKKVIIIVFGILFFNSYAQDIQMEFPYLRGKAYDFIIFQGTRPKTVIQDTIPQDGRFTLSIPKEYAPYTGMSRWLITGTIEGGGLDMVIPGHNFSVSSKEAKPDDNNIIYNGNTQVKELNTFYKEQQDIFARHDAMMQAVKAFPKTDTNYPVFEKEYNNQLVRYKDFQRKLTANSDYAKKFLQIVNITQGIGTEILDTEEKKAKNISEYLVREMDWQVLYTSGHWSGVISGWTEIHAQVLKNIPRFVDDFVTIGKKISNDNQYEDFAGSVAYSLTQQGKDDYIHAIAPLVVASGRIKNYEGPLAVYVKGIVGTQAPDLTFTEQNSNITLKSSELAEGGFTKTLLIFYKSDCGPCDSLLQKFLKNYNDIKSKKVRVVSISVDENENIYKEKIKNFLWKDYFQDSEGLKGANFKNYGIAGTPTMVLLDTAGKIILRTASLEELLNFLK